MKKDIEKLLSRKGALAENEVKDLMSSFGIRTTKYKLVNEEKDLENLGLRFPVALKVCSSKILPGKLFLKLLKNFLKLSHIIDT